MKQKQFFQWSIKIPKSVTIKKNFHQLLIIGPLGVNKLSYNTIDHKGDAAMKIASHILFFCSPSQSFLRVFSTLLTDKIYGVTRGYIIYLRVSGIGYRCVLEKKNLKYKILKNRAFKKNDLVTLPLFQWGSRTGKRSDGSADKVISSASRLKAETKLAGKQDASASHTSKFNNFSLEKNSEKIKPIKNQVVRFKVGFSHDIFFQIPQSMKVFVIKPTIFCVYGIDKNQVTQIASKIRHIQSPEVYKGKGISFLDEVITIKQGKRK